MFTPVTDNTPLVASYVALVRPGTAVLMTMALLAPNELAAPGVASVKVPALPAASLIVPLFKAKAVVLV